MIRCVTLPVLGGVLIGFALGFAASAAAVPLPESLFLQKPNEAVEAPDFTLKDVGGKPVRLKELRGKLVFLNFFATWCGPCRDEIPSMEQLHRAYDGKGLMFLAVDVREGAKAVRAFLGELRVSFAAVLDDDGSVSQEYGVRALPVSFLVGRDGMILWRAIGAREWNTPQARRYFDQMIGQK